MYIFLLQLWADDLYASPIMWTYTGTDILTHAAWNPTRPSVIILTGHSGRVEAWVREMNQILIKHCLNV